MINEIIDVYSKQLELYSKIKEMLGKIQSRDFDIIAYNLEFENSDFILNQIEKLNEKAEQLKLIYVSKNHLSDFTGEEIKRIENSEDYNSVKEVIENITKMIASVKQAQDSLINKINMERNINKRFSRILKRKML
jgi:hypothetical protein